MAFEVFKQLFKKPFTNKFPVKYIPKSVTAAVEKIGKGELKINPPIEIPPNFRGKISYDREKCIGCGICTKVCPAHAIELIPTGKDEKGKEKYKAIFYISRCTFCSQCVDACPKECISMSNEFLLADTDRFSDALVVK